MLVEQKEKDEVEEMVDNKINVSYEMHTKLGLDPEVEIKPEEEKVVPLTTETKVDTLVAEVIKPVTEVENVEKIEQLEKHKKSQIEASKTVKTGISFGSALAIVISYTQWHSIGWAIIHGLMSWGYVIYYLIKY